MAFGRIMGTAMVLGAGALALTAAIAAPRIFKVAKPYVREGLRRSISIYDRARAGAAELVEDIEDLVAEVRSDLSEIDGGSDKSSADNQPT